MLGRLESRITPTALYTGYVWCRNRLAPPWLATVQGRVMFGALEPMVRLGALGTHGTTLERLLLQRHRIIDAVLEQEIASGRVGQVVEIAAGLSGRGLRFVERHRAQGLVYVEADLPDMAARKQRLLAAHAPFGHHLHVVPLDVRQLEGPHSLEHVAASLLDREQGTAIITEGLLSYFPRDWVLALLSRIARFLRAFPRGLYLTDAYVRDARTEAPLIQLFLRLLSLFAATRVELHFADEQDVLDAALRSGFSEAILHRPSSHAATASAAFARAPVDYVRILAARSQTLATHETDQQQGGKFGRF